MADEHDEDMRKLRERYGQEKPRPETLREKLELIAEFYKDAWGSPLVQSFSSWVDGKVPDHPPTVEEMEQKLRNSSFPGMMIFDVEDMFWKARFYFYMATGEEKYL